MKLRTLSRAIERGAELSVSGNTATLTSGGTQWIATERNLEEALLQLERRFAEDCVTQTIRPDTP